MRPLPIGLLFLSSFSQLGLSYVWPSPQYEALEGLLYEGRTSDGDSLADLVHPCRKRVVTFGSIGAEWLRFAFHDMATHNVEDGTGGLDGSLVYELDRPENFGLGFSQTAGDFSSFPNKMVSRADVIALGTVHAVASCGGPVIPFRGGRVDSFVAGGTGTPEPQHDIATLTESFKKQGFSGPDMIKLVACGHTMGGVRSTDFPDLVPPSTTSDAPVITDFDTTMAFDNKIATEYLDGSTQNVLVVTSNKTMASDFHVFQSDGNSTIQSLASPDTFQKECRDVLARMLDTVPKDVTLTDEITLLHEKVTLAQLTIEKNKLVYKTNLRLTQPTNETANKDRVVTMFWCDRYGNNKDCKGLTRSSVSVKVVAEQPNISPVTQSLGFSFINYNFVVPIDAGQSISKFWFEVDEKDGSKATVYNNGGNNYVVAQDQVIFVPTLSTVDNISNGSYTKVYTNREGEAFFKSFNLVVGVRNELSPSRVYIDGSDSAVRNFTYVVSGTSDLTLNSSMSAVEGYKFYAGTFESSGLQLTIDVSVVVDGKTSTEGFLPTATLDNTPITAPGTVSTDKAPTSGAFSWRSREGWAYPLMLSVAAAMTLGVCPL